MQVSKWPCSLQSFRDPGPLSWGSTIPWGVLVQAGWLPSPRCNQEEERTESEEGVCPPLKGPAPDTDHLLASHW